MFKALEILNRNFGIPQSAQDSFQIPQALLLMTPNHVYGAKALFYSLGERAYLVQAQPLHIFQKLLRDP